MRHGARGFSGRAGCGCKARPAPGFTLIEVLLATVLLAAMLALALASVHAIGAMSQRGEAMAQANERMRAVQALLRRRLSGAQTIAFATDPSTLRPTRFAGDGTGLQFVANMPSYLGRGGPYLHELFFDEASGRLMLALSMVQAGQVVADPGAPPAEMLADGVAAVQFRYRGLAPEGGLGPWQADWVQGESLPVQVDIRVRPRQGPAWPELIVALAQGSGGTAGPEPVAPP